MSTAQDTKLTQKKYITECTYRNKEIIKYTEIKLKSYFTRFIQYIQESKKNKNKPPKTHIKKWKEKFTMH